MNLKQTKTVHTFKQFSLAIAFALILISSITGIAKSGLPMDIHGQVYIDGSQASGGLNVSARIDGIIIDSVLTNGTGYYDFLSIDDTHFEDIISLYVEEVFARNTTFQFGRWRRDLYITDVEPPTAPTGLEHTPPMTDDTPSFSWTASTDDQAVQGYYVNITGYTTYDIGNVTTWISPDTIADCNHTFNVWAYDTCNNSTVASLNFTIDLITPIVDITYPTNGTYFDSVSVIWINGTITEDHMDGLQPSINDTAFSLTYWNSGIFGFKNVSVIPDGTHYYKVNFTDIADRTGYDTVYFTVDTVPPVVDITHPADGDYFDSVSVIWINGTVTELNVGGLEPAINDTRFVLDSWVGTNFAFYNPSVLADDTYYVEVNFTDSAGKTGYDTVYFTVDTVQPVVEITSPTTGSPVSTSPGGTISVNYTYTELNPKNATIEVYNATQTIGQTVVTSLVSGVGVTRSDSVNIATWATEGNYTVTITIYDKAEKMGTDTEADAVIIVRAPITIEFLEGWNLIGIPVEPDNATIEAIFAENLTKVQAIYGYNQTWSSWISPGVGDLEELHAGMGYWVLTTEAFNQTIVGTIPDEAPVLVDGWNLIGIIGLESVPTEDYLPGYNWKVVYGYLEETGNWTYRFPGLGPLTTLEPGEGYWVLIDPLGLGATSTSTTSTSNSTAEWNPTVMIDMTRKTKIESRYE